MHQIKIESEGEFQFEKKLFFETINFKEFGRNSPSHSSEEKYVICKVDQLEKILLIYQNNFYRA